MAGSPIKRARKMGAKVPNLGGRMSRAQKAELERQRQLDERPLEGDHELQAIAKKVLRNVAERGHSEQNRVGSAKALAEVTRPQEMKHTIGFEGFSAEDVDELTKIAKAAVAPSLGNIAKL